MNKNKLTTIVALLLILTLAFTLAALPIVNAHYPPWQIPTYAYINVAPNPVGVGQQVAVTGWIDKVPPGASGPWGTRWYNMKVTVTKPDGKTEELGPFTSDSVGGIWTWYTPTQVGTYKFVCSFPGQVAKEENPTPPGYMPLVPLGKEFINDTYLPSTSEPFYLTVQQEPIESKYPPNPLPTEYWSRPISSMNREWYVIGGNWLGLGATSFGATGLYSNKDNFNPYTTAPNSAHVLWTEPIAFGGQIGGEFGPDETSLYATGTAYEAKFGAVILYGILYYTEYPGAGNNPTGLKAVDLRTGETVWEKPILTPLKCGMIYNFITGDQYGAHAYLFCAPATIGFVPYPPGNTWEMYDAMTGEWILNIANASAGTLVRGPMGEILSYTLAGGQLRMWNSSKCIAEGQRKYVYSTIYTPEEIWRPPKNATIDWNGGYQWSKPVATDLNGVPISPPLAITLISDDVVLATGIHTLYTGAAPGGSGPGYMVQAGYSAVDGRLLWGPVNRTYSPWTTKVIRGAAGDGVFAVYTMQTFEWEAYDIKSGQKLWGPKRVFNSSWAYYDYTAPSVIGYGNLYTWGLSGEVYCINAKTGEIKWSFNTGSSGVDSPFGSWPLGTWWTHYILADGKLYVRAGHDYTPPVFKGAKLYCLNASTGELIWSSLSFDIVGSPACADGIMVWFNGYDNQIYAYGKGPSRTTVTASPKVTVHGSKVLVEGMVTDESPGAKRYAQTARFPNGVPAISDEDMSAWMEYLYQQQPKPANAKGVDVTITVFDPNGNCYDVAKTTSDASGFYSSTFEPPVPGKYTVVATFAGSESYYGSSAETAIYVEEAPPAAPEATPVPQEPVGTYFAVSTILIIAAIAVAVVLLLRKR
ncbi:MAG: PQQ-binding-like beta-propeller repeat protein [Candidatus Bathyarchaeales archaeon]